MTLVMISFSDCGNVKSSIVKSQNPILAESPSIYMSLLSSVLKDLTRLVVVSESKFYRCEWRPRTCFRKI